MILPSGETVDYKDLPAPTSSAEDENAPAASNRETTPHPVETDLNSVKPGQVLVDKAQERFALGVAEGLLKPGSKGIKIKATWKDVLGGSMMGYYRSSFPHPDSKDKKETYYALTQFEPTAARRAYPAWDEPAIKATYRVGLVGRKGLVSLGNMPVESEGEWRGEKGVGFGDEVLGKELDGCEGDWTVTVFEKTPLVCPVLAFSYPVTFMLITQTSSQVSSYLVAFAHGPFAHLSSEYTSPLTQKTIPLKIYATPDLIGQAQFALDVKRLALPVYEEIFDVPYPLPKLDTLVAHDFDAGAMENWGLVS